MTRQLLRFTTFSLLIGLLILDGCASQKPENTEHNADMAASEATTTKTIRVYAIQHVDAAVAAEILNQFYSKATDAHNAGSVKAVADGETNTVIVTCSDETHAEIILLLQKLDLPQAKAAITPDTEAIGETAPIVKGIGTDARGNPSLIVEYEGMGRWTEMSGSPKAVVHLRWENTTIGKSEVTVAE